MTTGSSQDHKAGMRRAYLGVVLSLCCSIAAGLGLAVVYSLGGQAQLEGMLLAVSLLGIGIGIVLWAKTFLPNEEAEEARKPFGSDPEDVASFAAELERGEEAIGSRRLLLGLITGGLGALGLALVFPIRSLGPRPGRGLFETGMADGRRLVNADKEPVRLDDIPVGSVVTVWPEGHEDESDGSTLLIRVEDRSLFREPTVRPWMVESVVAYSKLCTHTGCPVGLYEADKHQLLCPCHQSTFDVLDGAKPLIGPAAIELPQLPLEIDAQGFVVGRGEFSDPVGPGFWHRS